MQAIDTFNREAISYILDSQNYEMHDFRQCRLERLLMDSLYYSKKEIESLDGIPKPFHAQELYDFYFLSLALISMMEKPRVDLRLEPMLYLLARSADLGFRN